MCSNQGNATAVRADATTMTAKTTYCSGRMISDWRQALEQYDRLFYFGRGFMKLILWGLGFEGQFRKPGKTQRSVFLNASSTSLKLVVFC